VWRSQIISRAIARVIASEAKQSSKARQTGLLRR
jgi:hypothetical protein